MATPAKKQSFLGGAAILAAAVVVVKIIGAVYKLPLNNILGGAGKTYFDTAYRIYNFLLTFSTAGLPLAISRMTSQAHAQGLENEKRKIFRTAIWLFFGLGLVCSVLMFTQADGLARFLNNSLAAPAVRALAPAVFCVCLLFLAVCALFVTKKEYIHNSRFYRALLCRSSAFALWFLRVHVHVSGTELLPQNGRLLFVGNHRSNFDPIIQWTVLPQWEIAFISKEGNFRIPFFGRFIRKCCFLSIDRSSPKRSVETMRKAEQLLGSGEVSVGVYPEGTRSKSGELLPVA